MVFDRRPLVVHVVNTLDGGGTEHALLALLRSFRRSCLRHAVVTLREAGSLSAHLPEDVACRALGLRGASRSAGLRLACALQRMGPAVVHGRNACTWWDTTVAGLLTRGVQVVLGFHGWDQTGGWNTRRKRTTRWCARMGAKFSSVSYAGRDFLVQDVQISRQKVAVLPNGVDVRYWSPPDQAQRAAARLRWGFGDHDVVAAAVGSLTQVKRHDRLLLAAAAAIEEPQAKHLRILVTGDGPLRTKLEAQVNRLRPCPHVVFTGHLDDARSALHAADMFVSASDAEGMSHALLEAMATGLPIVTTSVGDHAQIVRDGLAGLVVDRTVEALTRALVHLGGDESLRCNMGALARRRAHQFAFDATLDAYEAYYRSLVGSHHSRRAGGAFPSFIRDETQPNDETSLGSPDVRCGSAAL